MPRRISLEISESSPSHVEGAGTNYLIQTPTGVLYLVYVDSDSDVSFRKSTDGGLTWSEPTTVFVGTLTSLSVWYDRWSNISAGLIHCAYSESVTDDTLYRTIDTENNDTLSTQTLIFDGASTATGGHLSITRAVGGNVYCKTCIDAGTEGGFFRLPNANVPNGAWDAARTIDEALATTDQMILLPDYDAADTQDIMAIFWDASANEVSRKLHDDSANSWTETSIATSMPDSLATIAFPHFAVAMDIANTQHILVVWSDADAVNADLRCWTIDATTITAKTDVVTNSADDQGLVAITLDSDGKWWVFYAGKTDGSETAFTSLNIYCKCSSDSGSTWGPETKMTTQVFQTTWMAAIPRILSPTTKPPPFMWGHDGVDESLFINLDITQPKAQLQIGL